MADDTSPIWVAGGSYYNANGFYTPTNATMNGRTRYLNAAAPDELTRMPCDLHYHGAFERATAYHPERTIGWAIGCRGYIRFETECHAVAFELHLEPANTKGVSSSTRGPPRARARGQTAHSWPQLLGAVSAAAARRQSQQQQPRTHDLDVLGARMGEGAASRKSMRSVMGAIESKVEGGLPEP